MIELYIKAKLLAEEVLKLLIRKQMSSIAEYAKSKLGTDFTSDQVVPDEVSCAFAVTTILRQLFPDFPITNSTYELWRYLQNHAKEWERVYEPQAGDIVISATGTATRPHIIPNGHVGIYYDSHRIMSNSSNNGLWEINFNRDTWRDRYYRRGGYAVYLYRIKTKPIPPN